MSDIIERLLKSDPANCASGICPLLKDEAAAEIARLRERIKGHAQDGNELIRLLQKERERVRVLREECAASRCALKADGTTFPMGYRQKQRYINARSATDAAKAMEDKCPPTT